MIYIGLIIVGVLLIVLFIILIITIIGGSNTNKNDVYVDGGYNIETGLKENLSGKIFVGTEHNGAETYLMYGVGRNENIMPVNIYNLNHGQSYQYVNESEIYIGRDINRNNLRNFLYISDDGAISKVHCRILVNSSDAFVEDMNSSNHTYINGKITNGRVKINRGDIIKIGKTKLKIEV